MTKSVTCQEELGGLASQVTVDYIQLAQQGRLAAATAEPEEVRISLERQSVINRPVGWKRGAGWTGGEHINTHRLYNHVLWIMHTVQRIYKQEAQLVMLLKQTG